MDVSDEELYDAWAKGDKRAASALADRYSVRVYRFFANKVTNIDDAADLVGTTWEKLIGGLGTFEKRSSFRTYVFGIANNVLRDYVKKKGRRAGREVSFHDTSINQISATASVILDARKEQDLLYRALREIPLDYQVVLELSYFEQLSNVEIGKILGVPTGTVATRLRRGKALLREQIEALARKGAPASDPGSAGARLAESTLSHIRDWMDSVKAEVEGDGHDDLEDPGDPGDP